MPDKERRHQARERAAAPSGRAQEKAAGNRTRGNDIPAKVRPGELRGAPRSKRKLSAAKFSAGCDAELPVNVAKMKLDRFATDVEAVGDLRVAHSLGNQDS